MANKSNTSFILYLKINARIYQFNLNICEVLMIKFCIFGLLNIYQILHFSSTIKINIQLIDKICLNQKIRNETMLLSHEFEYVKICINVLLKLDPVHCLEAQLI